MWKRFTVITHYTSSEDTQCPYKRKTTRNLKAGPTREEKARAIFQVV